MPLSGFQAASVQRGDFAFHCRTGDEVGNTVHDSTTSLSAPSQEASPNLKKLDSAESSSLDDYPPFSLVTLACVIRDGLSLRTQWEFLKLGMPGGCMMAAEASSFDITTAMAGLLGESHFLTGPSVLSYLDKSGIFIIMRIAE